MTRDCLPEGCVRRQDLALLPLGAYPRRPLPTACMPPFPTASRVKPSGAAGKLFLPASNCSRWLPPAALYCIRLHLVSCRDSATSGLFLNIAFPLGLDADLRARGGSATKVTLCGVIGIGSDYSGAERSIGRPVLLQQTFPSPRLLLASLAGPGPLPSFGTTALSQEARPVVRPARLITPHAVVPRLRRRSHSLAESRDHRPRKPAHAIVILPRSAPFTAVHHVAVFKPAFICSPAAHVGTRSYSQRRCWRLAANASQLRYRATSPARGSGACSLRRPQCRILHATASCR